MTATTWAQQLVEDKNNLIGGIINHLAQINSNKKGGTAPLIDNLEMMEVFKDKDEEEEASITDLIN